MFLVIKGLRIETHPKVYEPAEDSFLLLDVLEDLGLKGKDVLEIGIGTGVQSLFCSMKGANVRGVDINPFAVEVSRKNAELNSLNADFFESDLFSKVKGKFDLIIFNSPYLPEDMNFNDIYSKSWDGGKSGREIIDRFISEVGKYLKDKGTVLLVQSSLSGFEETINKFRDCGLKARLIKEQKFDFESIQVIEALLQK